MSYPGDFGFPLGRLGGFAKAINFNAVGDTPITIVTPNQNYRIPGVLVQNTGTTASLTTAQFGLFTASGGGGSAIIASGTALSGLTSNTVNTGVNTVVFTPAAGFGASAFNFAALFFRITLAQGAAATGNVYIWIQPLP